jgi:xanthine dehydrogenase small subunit
MIKFILNNTLIETASAPGTTLLDFVRYHQNLTGTKIGCREGDCGACTLMVGENIDNKVTYKTVTSCITPIGNVHGKHVVSIEGLNMEELSPVQQSIVDEAGTQCGFCTVGFVVSLTCSCMSERIPTQEEIINDIDGNICRCTGYKSLERAAEKIRTSLINKNVEQPIAWLTQNKFLPTYFSEIAERLKNIPSNQFTHGELTLGGGTDLYVQKHHETEDSNIHFTNHLDGMKEIEFRGNLCFIGGACTASDLLASAQLRTYLPKLYDHLKLVSSTPVRNIGTIAGNLVNASPIGDLTAMFLALNSSILLQNREGEERRIPLNEFYLGYKKLDKKEDEIVFQIQFELPSKNAYFNFEKISKRKYLDIASVNSALLIQVENNIIVQAHASAGGVGPTPIYLKATCGFLIGKTLSAETIKAASAQIPNEISPISDVRGTSEYKRKLIQRLFMVHFVELFPQMIKPEEVI